MEKLRRRKRVVFAGLLLSIAAAAAMADFSGGGHMGAPLTDAEWKALCNAIACLNMVDPASAACANRMKGTDPKNSHICREDGKDKQGAGAWTKTDGTAGKSGGDGINIPKATLTGNKDILAAILAHELVHVNELVNNDKPGAAGGPHRKFKEREVNPVKKEIEVLKKLAAMRTGDAKKVLEDRIKQLEDWLKVLCHNADKEEGKPVAEPPKVQGCPTAQASTSTSQTRYSVVSGEAGGTKLQIQHFESGVPSFFSEYDLPFAAAQDMELIEGLGLPGGDRALVLTGVNLSGYTGLILGLAADDSGITGELFLHSVPGLSPVRTAYDAGRGQIFIVDTESHLVQLLVDSDGDSVPESLAPQPFAEPEMFPFLADMNSAYFEGGALWLSQEAIDAKSHIYPYLDLQYGLWDDDGDGVADRFTTKRWREGIIFVPAFHGTPIDGMTSVKIFGGWGSLVEVQTADGALLGRAVVDLDNPATGETNLAIVNLERPLEAGDVIRVLDPTNGNFGMDPQRVTVRPRPAVNHL